MSEFFIDLTDLDAGVGDVGGKARGLARLIGAGLPVPRGFVARPGADLGQLAARARALRPPLVVRSSASIEDGARAAAPGIFATVRDVDHAGVEAAAVAVRASAESPVARAYADARGLARPIAMAVVVQEQVDGELAGTAFTRAPGDPDHVLIETAAPVRVARLARDGDAREVDPALADRDPVLDRVRALALAAEAAIDAGERGADVEWVWDGRAVWLVQARPIVRPTRAAPPAPASAFAPLGDGRWVLDASHNPGPLSPAQASLVAHVDRAGLALAPMRVIADHLYVRDDGAPAIAFDPADLADYFDRVARPAMEAILEPAEADLELTLDAALDAHDRVYRIYARELAPRVSAARRALGNALTARLPPAGAAAELARAAAGAIDRARLLAAIGFAAPAWDLACPTFAEDPIALDRALAAAPPPRPTAPVDPIAAAVHRVSEEDDLMYARAQWLVRRALLARARELGVGDAIFAVALDHAGDPDAIRAAAARPARAPRAMPLVIVDGVPERAPALRGETLRGRGTGGAVRGPAFRVTDHRATAPAGAIAIAPTLTPASALAVRAAAAIVCEHGGVLGHAAATARELGIPCVVGCTGAWTAIDDGDLVAVDGDAGVVVISRR